jgi:hypothetical protein
VTDCRRTVQACQTIVVLLSKLNSPGNCVVPTRRRTVWRGHRLWEGSLQRTLNKVVHHHCLPLPLKQTAVALHYTDNTLPHTP